jgi:hypothetical protein
MRTVACNKDASSTRLLRGGFSEVRPLYIYISLHSGKCGDPYEHKRTIQDTSRSKPDDLAHRRYPHVCTRCPESPWQQSYINSGLTVYPRAIRRCHALRRPDRSSGVRQSGRIFWGACLRSGRPRRPGKVFKKVGCEAPHLFEGLPGPPGPARLQKRSQKTPGQTASRYPARN